jgi:DNA-directed RNA polymerase specialized sigma24 family protein
LGFAIIVPVSKSSLALLLDDPCLSPLLRTEWVSSELSELAENADTTNVFYEARFACRCGQSIDPVSALSSLMRDHFGILSKAGLYFVSAFEEAYADQMKAMGYVPVPDMTGSWGGISITGYVLDLRRIGVEAWIEAITNGRPVPQPMPLPDLEAAARDALLHWRDETRLAQSPLLTIPALATTDPADPKALRQLIRDRLEAALAAATEDERAALHALELSYFTPGLSNERAAERLNVSRATFFRLLKRGLAVLAREIDRPPE